MTDRQLTFSQSIHEAIDLCMGKDPAVYIMGLGVPDPKGIFGTTTGLQEKFGSERVMDMPASEDAMTGVAIGSALVGMRPIMTHQRIDFALLAVEQLVNQAAKWHYMFAGAMNVPMVVRMIIGRGWGQGPQHSQSLQSWFAHIPGLKVVMPATPYDAKGLLVSSIEDNNPVIFLEHRWLYNIAGNVPEGIYDIPLGKARMVREGGDVTIASISYMLVEALRAAEMLAAQGIEAEVIDIRTLRPWDEQTVLSSVRKTGRLIVADTAWQSAGFSAEVVARVAEEALGYLKCPPRRIVLPDAPTPTTPSLADHYYPRAIHIANLAGSMLGLNGDGSEAQLSASVPFDIPDPSFTGPF